jgi:hypothetical protein
VYNRDTMTVLCRDIDRGMTEIAFYRDIVHNHRSLVYGMQVPTMTCKQLGTHHTGIQNGVACAAARMHELCA